MSDAFPWLSPPAWMVTLAIFAASSVLCLVSGLLGAPGTARLVIAATGLIGGALEAYLSVATLIQGQRLSWIVPSALPYWDLSFRLDPLSAIFTLALGLVSAAAALYAYGYAAGWSGGRVGWLGFFVNLLVLSLSVVFTASNVLTFLVAWEVMALAAYCLVSFDQSSEESREAGILFFVMSHVGTGFLIAGFLLLSAWSGSFEFAAFQRQIEPWRYGVLFCAFFAGLGVKAGAIPLHVWLPAAHPVAPSNVSALMSGIMVKTGIYGLLRVWFEFLGAPPLWASLAVLAVGLATGLIAVLYAVIETDLKRLLAYSTIENVGIVWIATGAGMVFQSLGKPALAAIALAGALAHIFNHALFKSLLFLGAGSVLHASGSRNMELLGGLIRRMPVTAFLFLTGSVAISGLPPLNGFLSEWLIYQALLAGYGSSPAVTRLVFPLAGSLLALTAALAATAFVKAFGITFLALPRSSAAAKAHESHWSMNAGAGVLAAACVLVALAGPSLAPALDTITDQLVRQKPSSMLTASPVTLASGAALGGVVSNAALAAVLCLISLLAFGLARMGRGPQRRLGPTWDCGLPGLTEQNQYTATAFSKPIRMVFAALFQPNREIVSQFDISPYFPKAVSLRSDVEQTFEEKLYRPVKSKILEVAGGFRRVQAGSVHAYLAYIFIALVALLIFGVRP